MKQSLDRYTIIALAVLSVVSANAQTGSNATKHYEKGRLAFDYPEGWGLIDSTSQGEQTVTLVRKGSVAQIVVSMQDGLTRTCDFESERKKIAGALIVKVATQIRAVAPLNPLPVSAQIGGSGVEGVQLKGVVNRKPITGAVYSTRRNQHFVSLIYIVAKNNERAKSAWDTVRTTLKVEPPVLATRVAGSSEATVTPGMMRGRLVSLPQPDYPKIAKSAHVAGNVNVQVTIGETGNVISAHAVEGHPLLRAASVAAAKQAKFSTTKLCGEPVRVAGIITYNFVAQ